MKVSKKEEMKETLQNTLMSTEEEIRKRMYHLIFKSIPFASDKKLCELKELASETLEKIKKFEEKQKRPRAKRNKKEPTEVAKND